MVKANTPSTLPLKYQPQRVRRTRLQSALKSRVPEGTIKLQKRLSSIEKLDDGSVKLHFDDSTDAVADLIVGGDGIRSVSPLFLLPLLASLLRNMRLLESIYSRTIT